MNHNHKEQANHRVPADGRCGPRDDGEAPRDQGRPEAEGTASSGCVCGGGFGLGLTGRVRVVL